jgi:hypothetical protein
MRANAMVFTALVVPKERRPETTFDWHSMGSVIQKVLDNLPANFYQRVRRLLIR